MTKAKRDTHVVIVGGGFGGLEVARRLGRRSDPPRVTLIDRHNFTTFSPMLPEVVSTSVLPGQVIAPFREMLAKGQDFVMGEAVGLDVERRRVRSRSDGVEEWRPYDHLVLAVGARARLDIVPGLAEHAIPLKLIGDAMELRNAVIARLERADHARDPVERRRLVHFVVVGGGFSGVEVAGEIHDFIRAARRLYPNVPRGEPRVTVVHAGERLLPELPERLGRRAADSMTRRGIGVRLSAKARSADAEGLDVETAEGASERIAAGTLVSTIGTAPHPLVERLGLPTAGGRLETAPDLSVAGAPGVWAVGDCAAIPNAATGETAPTTAQFATREAATLARNIAAVEAGRQTRAFSFGGLGTIATMGNKRGVADVMGVPISGFPAWLMWRAFYLSLMPTLSRKVRIWVAWTWDMLFPRDVAQLSFSSSRGDAARQAEPADAEAAPAPDEPGGERRPARPKVAADA